MKTKAFDWSTLLEPKSEPPRLADRLVPDFMLAAAMSYTGYRPNTSFFSMVMLRGTKSTKRRGSVTNDFEGDAAMIARILGSASGTDLAEFVPAGSIGIDPVINVAVRIPEEVEDDQRVAIEFWIHVVEMGRPSAPD